VPFSLALVKIRKHFDPDTAAARVRRTAINEVVFNVRRVRRSTPDIFFSL
jgi:hypothetical protein